MEWSLVRAPVAFRTDKAPPKNEKPGNFALPYPRATMLIIFSAKIQISKLAA